MFDEFHLFSKIALLLILAVIVIALYQHHRSQAIDVSSPRWLVVLMSPATVLTIVPVLFSLWIVGSTWLYGATIANVFGLFLAAFCCYAFRAILHRGAKVHLPKSVGELQWWLDASGNLHPHFKPIENADGMQWQERKEQAMRLLAEFEAVSEVGKPVVVASPFKLKYLTTKLVKQGWQVEISAATRCPWIVKVALLMRRGKLQLPLPSNGWGLMLPTNRDWRVLALMHHAVLSPPGYPVAEIHQLRISPPASEC